MDLGFEDVKIEGDLKVLAWNNLKQTLVYLRDFLFILHFDLSAQQVTSCLCGSHFYLSLLEPSTS